MNFKITFISFITLSSLCAQAQMALMPEPPRAVPHVKDLQSPSNRLRAKHFISQDKAAQLADQVAQNLSSQFKKALKPLEGDTPSCQQKRAVDYLNALRVAGRFQECSDFASQCQGQTSLASPLIFTVGGLCEADRMNFKKADVLFDLSGDKSFINSNDYPEALFQFASYAIFGYRESESLEILSRSPKMNKDAALYKGVIHRAGQLPLGTLKKSEIDTFLTKKISSLPSGLAALFKILEVRIAYGDYDYPKALQKLSTHITTVEIPLGWYNLTYGLLYYGLDQDFAQARKVYDAYEPFANPWWSFPVENNTYTYTELYTSVCKNQLSQGELFDLQKKLTSDFRHGDLALKDMLEKFKTLTQENPRHADLLTVYGSLLALDHQYQQAVDSFWQARKSCPYYHRANWGLELERRRTRYAQMPEYAKNIERLDRELNQKQLPQNIENYITNWKSLTPEVQKRSLYGSRIWMPYFQELASKKMTSYIKYSFELLSETPGFENIKDLRIGGKDYPNDNRLWDDVRGIGGENVVADLWEVFNGIHGDYNLLGHEIAHQFQQLVEKDYPTAAACIEKQYQEAKAANNFPDSYSSHNSWEHFAQGVTYYLVPSDSPARYGLNMNWLKENNPSQLSFIQSIEQADGRAQLATCR